MRLPKWPLGVNGICAPSYLRSSHIIFSISANECWVGNLKKWIGCADGASGDMSAAKNDEAEATQTGGSSFSYGIWPNVEIWQSISDLEVPPRPIT